MATYLIASAWLKGRQQRAPRAVVVASGLQDRRASGSAMPAMRRKTCLVTGGAGFIGSHLAERLVGLGCAVRVVDNLSSGDRANLTPVADAIDFLEGDLCDPEVCCRARPTPRPNWQGSNTFSRSRAPACWKASRCATSTYSGRVSLQDRRTR